MPWVDIEHYGGLLECVCLSPKTFWAAEFVHYLIFLALKIVVTKMGIFALTSQAKRDALRNIGVYTKGESL